MSLISGPFKEVFYEIYLNSIKMLKARQLEIIDKHPLSKNEFLEIYVSKELFIVTKDKKGIKTALHISKIQDSFIKPHVESAIKEAKKLDVSNLILVIAKRSKNSTIPEQKINISFMFHWELYCDLISHELVPKHILLSPEAEKKLFENSTIGNKNNLPKIKISDPVSRYYGAKIGQIFFIRRKLLDGSGLFETVYRVVVP